MDSSNLTIHEKINFRSHFESGEVRAVAPYSKKHIRDVRVKGYRASYLLATPYGVRVDGTVFNKRGGNLKN